MNNPGGGRTTPPGLAIIGAVMDAPPVAARVLIIEDDPTVAEVVGHWYEKRPEVFENRDLDLAVAAGAAYYSYVRSTGSGVLVRVGVMVTQGAL